MMFSAIALQAPDSVAADKDQCAAKWINNLEMLLPVPMARVPGGFAIESSKNDVPILLTEQFFKNAKIEIPADAERVDGYAYRYAPDSEDGGGRDTLINDSGKAEKGTGGNPYFSPKFVADDFRSNGLQAVGDMVNSKGEHSGGGIPEYITFKNLSKLGANVIEPTDAAILPEAYQIGLKGRNPDYNRIAMKVRRDIRDPLQRATKEAPSDRQIFKLSSDFYFFNLSDGAINPDNVTATAKLKDPGHISFGYPITSSAYRCTTCVHDMGSSHDGTLIGILDYYFRDKKFNPGVEKIRSYSHVKFSKSEATDFMQALLANLNSRPFKSKIEKENVDWIYDVTQEKFTIEPPHTGIAYANRSRELLKTQQEMVGTGEKTFSDLRYKPERQSLSMRFILQLASLENELGRAKFDEAVDHVSTWLIGDPAFIDESARVTPKERQVEFVKLTNWVAGLLREKKVSSSDLEVLFKEYAPKSEIEAKMAKRLDKSTNFSEAVDAIRKTTKEFQDPNVISPKKFHKYMMQLDLAKLNY